MTDQCTVEKQQSVFGRLLMIDCQKHSMEHCLIGLLGWMYPVLSQFLEGQIRHSVGLGR